MPNDLEYEVLAPLRERLLEAGHGGRTALVAEAAALLGCSTATAYRRLQALGWTSGRQRRADAGSTAITRAELELISGVLMASINGHGQRMPLGTAIDMLRASGQLATTLSESSISRALTAQQLHPEQLTRPSEAKRMSSRHPNHVWQFDSTTGAFYYLPGGRLSWMDEAEFNTNKPGNLIKAGPDLLTRYCVTDHTSAAFRVRYYLGGERAENLVSFLVWAMWQADGLPMYGVPAILMGDQGPANKSHLFRSFASRLDCEVLLHAPRNARATGSVEKSHDIARMHLESRYKFVDAREVTLDWLNAAAAQWSSAYCSTRVHTRHGMTRYAAWMLISRYPGALRVAASLEALQDAATGRPSTPRVDGSKRISVDGRMYYLGLIDGVHVGQRVSVQVNVFRAPSIDVTVTCPDTGRTTTHQVEPERTNEFGFTGQHIIGEGYQGTRGDARSVAKGKLMQEAYRGAAGALPTQDEADRMRRANAQAYAGQVDALADVHATQLPTYLPARGTTAPLQVRAVEVVRISTVEAAGRLLRALGGAYTPAVYAELQQRYPDGAVPETDVDDLAGQWRRTGTLLGDDDQADGLRSVGGGAA